MRILPKDKIPFWKSKTNKERLETVLRVANNEENDEQDRERILTNGVQTVLRDWDE